MSDDDQIRYKYAWDWFKYHANQRLTAFHFFLIILSAIIIGYANTIEKMPIISFGISMLGIVVPFVFYVLDIRNEELVNCGRHALDELEKQLNVKIRENDANRNCLFETLEYAGVFAGWLKKWDNKKISHRHMFRLLELFVMILFVIAAIAAYIQLSIVIRH